MEKINVWAQRRKDAKKENLKSFAPLRLCAASVKIVLDGNRSR